MAQLVARRTGWVLTDHALDKTADGGATWTGVTPPGVQPVRVRGVFFLDPRDGWVVAARAGHPEQLQISTTADGGASWSTSPLGQPDGYFADSAALPAYVDFIDPRHGWVVAMSGGGGGYAPGILLKTSDGGATWQRLPVPTGGPVEFISPSTGWLTSAGQPGTRFSESFYVTRDGGRTWRPETVTPPAGFHRDQAIYAAPAFTTPAHVLLAAFDNGARSAAGFYRTRDGGATWHLAAIVPAGRPAGGDVGPAAAVASASHWVAVSLHGTASRTSPGMGPRKPSPLSACHREASVTLQSPTRDQSGP
ncbi:MAG: WD40/YVTN/BNR-like repeat-containing protein [Streptosporangiaceae bacterium]